MSVLYLVATPIGNLADISLHAIKIMQEVDAILVEDKRQSLKLFKHYDITTPMLNYHEHTDEKQHQLIIQKLQQGQKLALISDAGTPLISDPGYKLVRQLHELNIAVVPIAGACAAIAALSASGLPTDSFCFEGFLPAKSKARQDELQNLVEETRTMIFYEAPHRILATLADVVEIFGGQRQVCLARELTKTFETIKQLPSMQMLEWVKLDANQQKGEIVLMIAGCSKSIQQSDLSSAAQMLAGQLVKELPPKTASKIVAEHYQCSKKLVYEYILSLK